jgi:hypothetical protein
VESAQGQLILFTNAQEAEHQHAAKLLATQGVLGALRYEAVDANGPRYETCYDLERPDVAQSAEFKLLPVAEWRVLMLLLGSEPWSDEPPYQLTFAYEPVASTDEVINWYRDEHIPLLLQIDGWRRIRLYERLDGAGPRIVALHELESPAVFETDGYRHATTTPWREQIVGRASGIQRYLYKFLQTIQKP